MRLGCHGGYSALVYNAGMSGRPTEQDTPLARSQAFRTSHLSAANTASRFWEVDVARGVAIVMVAVYHLVYDLDFFGGYPVDSTAGFWAVFADTSAFAFVFLVGLSLTLSAGRPGEARFRRFLRRGIGIFGYGMGITLVFLVLQIGYVIFGILHLIGLSIVLSYPFLRLRLANLALGTLIIAAGLYVGAMDLSLPGVGGVLLSPLGISPEGLMMPDYRPLLPWFGVVLLGIAAGNLLYAGRKPSRSAPAAARPLAFLGRHTLFIYLVHQPVLMAILAALGIVSF